MTWVQDGTAERESASGGPVVLTGISTAGGGASNDDYLIVVCTNTQHLGEIGLKFDTVLLEDDDNPGTGGNLTELLRSRIAHGANPNEGVTQVWAIRNADFSGGAIDMEAAPSLLRLTATGTAGSTHMSIWIYRSDALLLTGSLLDFVEGGLCQVEDDDVASDDAADSPDFPALLVENVDDANGIGLVARYQAVNSSISGQVPNCDVRSFALFDNIDTTHARITGWTSTMAMGRGMDANQCLANQNSGADTALALVAIHIGETVVAGGPFIPFLDGVDDFTRSCVPDNGTPTATPRRRKGRKVFAIFEPAP